MKLRIYKSAEEYAKKAGSGCVATLGTFDGVHRGHASILENLIGKSRSLNLPPVLITFDPHPRVLVTPDDPPLLITTPEEKIEILGQRFEGSLVFLKFDDSLRQMTAEQFARQVLVDRFGIKALVVGYNHCFGHGRSGNIDQLAQIGSREGFDLEVVSPVTYKDMPISSSRIRRAIRGGELVDARRMLGHPYSIHGTIIRGFGHGKKMGWPTINLKWSERKILPIEGVYSCSVSINGSIFRGMMFVGTSMFNLPGHISVEVNLFDFGLDVRGKEVTIHPDHYIRPNIRFDSPDELSRQIAEDKKKVLKLID